MNEFEPVTTSQIDRLVDGELNRAERRAVLLALDHEENGWRRLALAFLESQGLRDALRNVPAVAPATPELLEPVTVRAAVITPSPASARKWRPVFVTTVCSLLMFGLGRLTVPANPTEISDQMLATRPTVSAGMSASRPATYATSNEPQSEEDLETAQIAEAGVPIARRTMRLEFGDGHGGKTQLMDVPVIEDSEITPEEFLSAPPLISSSDQRALLLAGQRVYEQRQLVEVILSDGRKGVLPISKVLVESLGSDAFQ